MKRPKSVRGPAPLEHDHADALLEHLIVQTGAVDRTRDRTRLDEESVRFDSEALMASQLLPANFGRQLRNGHRGVRVWAGMAELFGEALDRVDIVELVKHARRECLRARSIFEHLEEVEQRTQLENRTRSKDSPLMIPALRSEEELEARPEPWVRLFHWLYKEATASDTGNGAGDFAGLQSDVVRIIRDFGADTAPEDRLTLLVGLLPGLSMVDARSVIPDISRDAWRGRIRGLAAKGAIYIVHPGHREDASSDHRIGYRQVRGYDRSSDSGHRARHWRRDYVDGQRRRNPPVVLLPSCAPEDFEEFPQGAVLLFPPDFEQAPRGGTVDAHVRRALSTSSRIVLRDAARRTIARALMTVESRSGPEFLDWLRSIEKRLEDRRSAARSRPLTHVLPIVRLVRAIRSRNTAQIDRAGRRAMRLIMAMRVDGDIWGEAQVHRWSEVYLKEFEQGPAADPRDPEVRSVIREQLQKLGLLRLEYELAGLLAALTTFAEAGTRKPSAETVSRIAAWASDYACKLSDQARALGELLDTPRGNARSFAKRKLVPGLEATARLADLAALRAGYLDRRDEENPEPRQTLADLLGDGDAHTPIRKDLESGDFAGALIRAMALFPATRRSQDAGGRVCDGTLAVGLGLAAVNGRGNSACGNRIGAALIVDRSSLARALHQVSPASEPLFGPLGIALVAMTWVLEEAVSNERSSARPDRAESAIRALRKHGRDLLKRLLDHSERPFRPHLNLLVRTLSVYDLSWALREAPWPRYNAMLRDMLRVRAGVASVDAFDRRRAEVLTRHLIDREASDA